jgi:hypothetical protein
LHSLSVWYNVCNAFSSETACRPPGKPPQTTVWEKLLYEM